MANNPEGVWNYRALRSRMAKHWPGWRPKRDPAVLVGTHHKTGTAWMVRTFQRVAAELGWDFCSLERDGLARAHLYFSHHSVFPDWLTQRDFRGLHVIRDPRDVVISGMHYHKHSSERWLHLHRPEFGGLTYQQKINSLPPEEQLAFEMNQCGRWTIARMLAWRYDNPRFFEAKYETLIRDVEGEEFSRILSFLGFGPEEISAGVGALTQESLFADRGARRDDHIRSGKPAQWITEFSPFDARLFLDLHGECLIGLGYERDNSWVDRVAG